MKKFKYTLTIIVLLFMLSSCADAVRVALGDKVTKNICLTAEQSFVFNKLGADKLYDKYPALKESNYQIKFVDGSKAKECHNEEIEEIIGKIDFSKFFKED